ncbi:hypothetical protein QFC22_005243 [Naganishia vaughanmartiniae]|uniref:Uncharacterized protein n=1 Tax=Naganishia vaughanmartiniae TaxID=1424756 RepID=A0ACC2WWE5_9TREE|nr:hypothetical protein QFC22_005243 [Naganishia vaughanmartiniae]
MSDQTPQPKASFSKPAQQPKTSNKDKSAAAAPSAGAESKGKSAKDLKKEKRAAAVAARGGDADAGPSQGGEPSHAGPKDKGGRDGKAAASSTKQAGKSSSSTTAVGATAAGNTTANLRLQTQNQLFSHLPTYKLPDSAEALMSGKIHPIIIRYGILIASGQIRGVNARTIGLMAAFKEVVKGFTCPPEELHRLLPAHLSPMIAFLDQCRPKGVAGGNAIRHLKSEINRIGTDKRITEEAEQKDQIINAIDEFVRDRIELADEVICTIAVEKIKPGDTIVTFARSSLVERVLIEAWARMQEQDVNNKFHVVVVDSRPLCEGKQLLSVLTSYGIPTTYTLLSSLASILPRTSLVLLGTAALLSDGALYSRAGTAVLAMLAKESKIPVVACCETYKFGDKIVLDAVTGNELGDGSMIAAGKDVNLSPVHLLYDLTPPNLVTAVCTEVGLIPPSSVPTVITKGDAAGL